MIMRFVVVQRSFACASGLFCNPKYTSQMCMGRIRLALIFAALFGLSASTGSAGIYSTIDMRQETVWNPNFEAFEKTLDFLKAIRLPEAKDADSPMRQRYLLIDALGRDGTLSLKTFEQKLNYSAVLIRRGKAYEATQILHPLSIQYPDNFLVWSQLGTAKFLSGNSELSANAPDCIKQARELWPTPEKKLDPALAQLLPLTRLELPDPDFEQFLRIEKCLERLMRSRLKAERYAKKNKPLEEAIDPIFLDEESKEDIRPPVKFLNEKGEFEPGFMAKVEKAKLPADALEIVQQLLIWMPNDDRLMWLLGEVYNANATGADKVNRNNMLSSAYKVFNGLHKKAFESSLPFAGAIAKRREALMPFAQVAYEEKQRNVQNRDLPKDVEIEKPGEWPLDWWRTVIAGFIAGLAVGMFSIWQLQEIRRRRQTRA
jgi:hypothetical protein